MKSYWPSRGELSVVQNILHKALRIEIPSMRLEILYKVHEGHQGITKSGQWTSKEIAEFAPYTGTIHMNYLVVPGKL